MKHIHFMAAIVALCLAATACQREEEPAINNGTTADTTASQPLTLEGYLIVGGDTLKVDEIVMSEYDGIYEYALIPENDRSFAIVSATELTTGQYDFVTLDKVYAHQQGVSGIRPSTCAPEYFSIGTLDVVRQGSGYQLDCECSTPMGETIKAHYIGRI